MLLLETPARAILFNIELLMRLLDLTRMLLQLWHLCCSRGISVAAIDLIRMLLQLWHPCCSY